ncbi:MAG: DUF1847 domain-containing protein [Ignavibacteria bacterium]|nr:DUF1847 domain-containing protein [Ignavibacteria bacterium]
MNCTSCTAKSCRQSISCGAERFGKETLQNTYQEAPNQAIVQAAADLVDNGKAGTLSRLQELVQFCKSMNYQKVGLAYCYGMEKDAIAIRNFFKSNNISITAISCTVGGVNQNEINSQSCTEKVSCNPIGQAEQLNAENADFVMIMGICLGHDILLQKNLKCDFSTILVKDRVYPNKLSVN